MTSSLHHNFRRQAFTLVELMVVIGLVVVLLAFAVPMIARAHKTAVRTAMAADLGIIAGALDAYRADFGDFPRVSHATGLINGKPVLGAAVLCWALIAPGPATGTGQAPGDGADGPGFRTRGVTGTVKGPYLPVDRFTIGLFTDTKVDTIIVGGTITPQVPTPLQPIQNNLTMIADRYLQPILYFPANKAADPYSASVGGAYVNKTGSPFAMFNYTDNNETPEGGSLLHLDFKPNKLSQEVMSYRLGVSGLPPNQTLRASDTPVSTGPYLLWSAGPDAIFGSADDLANSGTDLQLNTSRVPATFGSKDPNPDIP